MPLNRFQGALIPLSRQALGDWQRSPRGLKMLALEQQEVHAALPEVFGRHLLQIGSWGVGERLIAAAETLHRAVLGTVRDEGVAAIIDPEHLPLPDKSIDAVLLPHTLEFARSPHNVLREADRVLSERGRLFIMGFNPWSGWALRRRLGFGGRFPAGAHFYSAGRMCDWLELLDFEVMQVRRYGAGFPWLAPHNAGEAWSLRSLLAGFAEAYLLVAKKRVLPMNFTGKVERAQIKPLVGVPVPAARSQPFADKKDS